MKCPFCQSSDSKVIDSRQTDDGASIRRRRECLACQKRFTTFEIVEIIPLIVIKKDGSRQSFDRNKLLNGLIRACYKRPVSLSDLETIVTNIETSLQNDLVREIESRKIGDLVMERLKKLDEIAYVRFASVYRQFGDVSDFVGELKSLMDERDKE